jgi:hypothetical protein
MLRRSLEKLRAKHPGVRIIYGDYFTPIIQFLLNAEKFGEFPSSFICVVIWL